MNERPQSAISFGAGNDDPLRAARELLDVLESEHRALQANDVETLESAVRAKQALVARLRGFDARRHDGADPEMKSLLERCRNLNEENGAIVAARMHLTRCSLAILRGENETALYGPEGSVPGGATGRSIARA
jgi:flagellar biosynthesis/type III secretory pathway chaperone